mmetsp:Transcript_18037/g.39859  ORF Transcript_18037/g.39859 Transcript_18037/m.39859 type:complete len:292 (-) Transcript_18037:9-884(-)
MGCGQLLLGRLLGCFRGWLAAPHVLFLGPLFQLLLEAGDLLFGQHKVLEELLPIVLTVLKLLGEFVVLLLQLLILFVKNLSQLLGGVELGDHQAVPGLQLGAGIPLLVPLVVQLLGYILEFRPEGPHQVLLLVPQQLGRAPVNILQPSDYRIVALVDLPGAQLVLFVGTTLQLLLQTLDGLLGLGLSLDKCSHAVLVLVGVLPGLLLLSFNLLFQLHDHSLFVGGRPLRLWGRPGFPGAPRALADFSGQLRGTPQHPGRALLHLGDPPVMVLHGALDSELGFAREPAGANT